MDTRQRTVLVYPVVYPNFFTHVTPPTWATPGGYVYITGRYTDWVQTMVTTISYLLWHLHGSLTCPPAMLHRHAVYGDYRVCDGGW